jgi:hypothetical protein
MEYQVVKCKNHVCILHASVTRRNGTKRKEKRTSGDQKRAHHAAQLPSRMVWPTLALSVISTHPFYKIFVLWNYLHIFSRIFLRRWQWLKSSSSSEEGKSCCSIAAAKGKSTSSHHQLPWHGEKSLITMYNNNIIIILRDLSHPLVVCVDRNPRSSSLNLVHVCAWGSKIILG